MEQEFTGKVEGLALEKESRRDFPREKRRKISKEMWT